MGMKLSYPIQCGSDDGSGSSTEKFYKRIRPRVKSPKKPEYSLEQHQDRIFNAWEI